jgi:DNA-3-methyladenine glycosylase II
VDGTLVPCRITVGGSPDRPRVRVTFAGPDGAPVRAAVRRQAHLLLGLDSDLADFHARAAADPVLGSLVARAGGLWGLRPSVTPDPLEMLVGAISTQQVNLAFAFLTRARLVRRYGEAAVLEGVTVYAFPTAAALARADATILRAMQFSTRKAEYIVALARAVDGGALDLAALAAASDDEVLSRLTAVRGLGRWTAEWFLARALGRPDVCPAGDLGVRRAVEALCFRGRPCDEARVRRRAEAWRPHRTLAVHYLLAGHRLPRAVASPVRRSTAAGLS